MTRDQYLFEVARIHAEWVKDIRVAPDPKYTNNNPSQYSEHAETVSASVEEQDRYWSQIQELTKRYHESNGIIP